MNVKKLILGKICYTDLVYGRINKKLLTSLTRSQIEEMIFMAIKETSLDNFQKQGKNYYISNTKKNIKITINSSTYRVITADKLIN